MDDINNQIEATQQRIEQSKPIEELTPSVPLKPEKPKQSYKCLVCGKSYSKKTSLFTHHKTHPEHCVHCGINRGSSVENIYEHNLIHVNIRPFVCKICGDSFLRNQQFVEHEKSHLEKKNTDSPTATSATTAATASPKEKDSKYKCKTCQLSYKNWKLFYKHQQETNHFNEKFLCEICGSEFHSNFLLSQHIRRLHKRSDETFPCSSCSKIFASKPNLDSHIKKIHQNDNNKTHRCEICNNLFSSAPNLKQHIKIVHEVEKEYECQTCKRPFKAKNRLTRHEKEVHMGKNGNSDEGKTFNCDFCEKKYKRLWHQTRHNQMKHENSNASTTSSTGTPPTPTTEINGNINLPSSNNCNNTNYNFQIQPIVEGINNTSAGARGESLSQNVWNNQVSSSPHQIQHPVNHHHPQQIQPESQISYDNRMTAQAGGNMMNNGEYIHYAVNEQYSNKFDVQTIAPTTSQHVSYDSWMNQPQQQQHPPPPPSSWDYTHSMHHYPHTQSSTDWSNYYDPSQHQHHAMYNNYKTDYNCLNQPQQHPPMPQSIHQSTDPAMMYNGANNYYYYPQQQPDPYINQNQPQQHPTGMEYQNPNASFQNNM